MSLDSSSKPAPRSRARRFVVAQNRNRDFYQVPLALYESDRLARLVTDIYQPNTGLGRHIHLPGLSHRQVEGLPSSLVTSSMRAVLLQVAGTRLGWEDTIDRTEAMLGRIAAHIALRQDADLLLYSQHALEAFTDPHLKDRMKGLFLLHPHFKLIAEILEQDAALYPETAWSYSKENDIGDTPHTRRVAVECDSADFILCASSFTRRSLIHAGYDPQHIRVAPYGTTLPPVPGPVTKASGHTRFLFVGQGVQRKGLHHLLRAWRQLGLSNATLRIVAWRMDPGFPALASENVEISGSLSREELDHEFAISHVFAMPSLIEGFGLVYLEALAAGCCLLATPNTGVPDMNVPADLHTLVEAGDVGAIAEALATLHERNLKSQIDYQAIADHARTIHWGRFRQIFNNSLDELVQISER